MITTAHFVLVDTDVVSYRFGNAPEFKRFQSYLEGKIPTISFITLGEALGGALYAGWKAERIADYEAHLRSHYLPISIDRPLAWERAKLFAECKRRGTGITEPDLWIAATAIRFGMPLLTNDRNFRRVPGLIVLPPEEEVRTDDPGFRF